MRIEPLPLKEEGQQFDRMQWEPVHPAKNCQARFQASVNLYGRQHTPRGQAWQFEDHVWTCYMWLRDNGEMIHRHDHWIDSEVLRKMVAAGKADDPFLAKKFVGKLVDKDTTCQS